MLSVIKADKWSLIYVMKPKHDNKEQAFLSMLDDYKSVIAKVCCVYASPGADFGDLYQETVVNLWQGYDRFRGDAKISTWIYRVAINTCITWIRRNRRYRDTLSIDEVVPLEAEESTRMADYKQLQMLISQLEPLEKAVVTLWLDEKSYEEIAAITGLSQSNVGVKIHRIKDKLAKLGQM